MIYFLIYESATADFELFLFKIPLIIANFILEIS